MPDLSQEHLHKIAQDYFRSLLIEGNDLIFKIENDLYAPADQRANEQASWCDTSMRRETDLRELDKTGEGSESFLGTADQLLQKDGIDPKTASDTRYILSQYILRAKIEKERIFQAKIQRRYSDIIPIDPLFAGIVDDALPPMPEFGLGEPSEDHSLGELIAKFKAAHEKKWIYKTRLDFDRMLGRFEEWFGPQKKIKSLTTIDIGEYRDALLKLPKRYPTKGKQALALREAIKNPNNAELIKPQSAEKYLNLTRSFLNWCTDEGYIDTVPGKKISIEYSVNEKPRLPYDEDQLRALFSSPIWAGCFSKARRSKPGNLIIQNAYYWIPLVGAYTGMRCGEIVQLRHKDIRTLNDIVYIDVNDDNQKKLKTKYSNRRIPLHPRLMEWGFLEFLHGRASPASDERIFKEVSISKQGDPSHAYSKTFSRYLKDVGVKNSHLSFHSFRHTFSDACDNASITEPQRKAMMGHSDQSASAQYGTGASIPVLFEAMSKISYAFETDFVPYLASSDIVSKG